MHKWRKKSLCPTSKGLQEQGCIAGIVLRKDSYPLLFRHGSLYTLILLVLVLNVEYLL